MARFLTDSEYYAQINYYREYFSSKVENSTEITDFINRTFETRSDINIIRKIILDYIIQNNYVSKIVAHRLNKLYDSTYPDFFKFVLQAYNKSHENDEKSIIYVFYVCPKLTNFGEYIYKTSDESEILYHIVSEEEYKTNIKLHNASATDNPRLLKYKAVCQKCNEFLDKVRSLLVYVNGELSYNLNAVETFLIKYIDKIDDDPYINRNDSSDYYFGQFYSNNNLIDKYISIDSHNFKQDYDTFKLAIIQLLYNGYKVRSAQSVRHNLITRLDVNGINDIIANISLDKVYKELSAEDEHFNTIFRGKTHNRYKEIISNFYLSELDYVKLNIKLIMALKLYYEYMNINASNAELLSKIRIKYLLRIPTPFLKQLFPYVSDIQLVLINTNDDQRRQLLSLIKKEDKRIIDDHERHKLIKVYIKRVLWIGSTRVEVNTKFDEELLNTLKSYIEVFNQRSKKAILIDIIFGTRIDEFFYEFYTVDDDYENEVKGTIFGVLTGEVNKYLRSGRDDEYSEIFFDYKDPSNIEAIIKERERELQISQ